MKNFTFDIDINSPRVPVANHPKFVYATNPSTLITPYSAPTSLTPVAHILTIRLSQDKNFAYKLHSKKFLFIFRSIDNRKTLCMLVFFHST